MQKLISREKKTHTTQEDKDRFSEAPRTKGSCPGEGQLKGSIKGVAKKWQDPGKKPPAAVKAVEKETNAGGYILGRLNSRTNEKVTKRWRHSTKRIDRKCQKENFGGQLGIP